MTSRGLLRMKLRFYGKVRHVRRGCRKPSDGKGKFNAHAKVIDVGVGHFC